MADLKRVPIPEKDANIIPILLSEETMRERKEKVLNGMRKSGFDSLVIYADIEHGNNFEYLTGFLPRFEEALLVLHNDGKAYMVLGNENLNKATFSRIEVKSIHMPHLSLPHQPMETKKNIKEILLETEISESKCIGLVGWKYFTSQAEDNEVISELPYFLVDSLKKICNQAIFKNASHLFIGENGARVLNNANEIAHYEFGAALAGNCILEAMNTFELGLTEMELASKLETYGQKHSVVTIMATGKRFENANLYPGNKIIKLGDRISMTTGYKGGLQSRVGYAANNSEDLMDNEKDYLDDVAKPYYDAVKVWLEAIHIGMSGKVLYEIIEKYLPKEKYHWELNPGHLCADEEWLTTPIYPESLELIQSGMIFQIDIIPSVNGYAGASCESGVVLADEPLREELKLKYPDVWNRIEERRTFIINELGIQISEEILPTSCVTAYYRPFFLNKEYAMTFNN